MRTGHLQVTQECRQPPGVHDVIDRLEYDVADLDAATFAAREPGLRPTKAERVQHGLGNRRPVR